MKRCPQCNRVEGDNTLAFCRVDGVTLVSNSSPIDKEAGTVRLSSGSISSEATATLTDSTNAHFNRATGPTTVLPSQAAPSTTNDLQLTRALELDPTSPGINLYYGALLEVSGRINESIQQYKKLIEMEPTYSWAHVGLARVYRRDGNHEGYVEAQARGFELSGNAERARAIRESFARGGWKGHLRENPNDPSSLAELGEYEKAIEVIVKQAERGWFWLFMHRTDPFPH